MLASLGSKPVGMVEQRNRINGNFSEWYADDSLPMGWKKLSCEKTSSHNSTGKVTKYQYLSTKNEIFDARSSLVDYMKKNLAFIVRKE